MNIAFVLSFVLVAPVASVDFDNDVIPILTKAGCNTAACHGSAAGRGSFKLSLYGGNPSADYDAIVRDFRGRRIHHADPRESLLLAKPIGEMEHGGDVRLDSDGQNVATIIRWIEEGASRVHSKRKLLRLEVTASKEILKSIPAEVQLHATAIYDNGQRRPVNDLAVFTAEDDTAIKVSQSGKATLLRRGRHNVHVRFLTEVVAVTLTAPLHDEPIDLAGARRVNYIDDEIYTVLEELRLPPSPRADAHTIWRRLRLDLTGRLPAQEDIAGL
mgnify:FL=1